MMLMKCPIEDIFFGGARGGGKTDGLLGHWLSHAARYGEQAKGILFRKTMPELDDVISRSHDIYPLLGSEFKSQKSVWVMPNGARLKLRYLEIDKHASRYQGHSYTWVGFDEMGNWATSEAIDKIRATLRSPYGIPCRFIGTGNPGGIGHTWIKERYIKNKQPFISYYDELSDVNRVYIPSRLEDNQILFKNDPKYISRLKSSGAPWLVRAWLDGDWDAMQEGAILKREWWQYFRLSSLPHFTSIIQSWDTAFKDKKENDASACLTIGVAENGFYILHVFCERMQYPDLKRAAINLAAKFKPTEILIEDKASGQSLIQELQRDTRLPIKQIQVDRDKIARANSVTGLLEAKRVFLPEGETWVIDFIEECALFPEGAHDDRVDALTQALNHLALFSNTGLIDYYQQLSQDKAILKTQGEHKWETKTSTGNPLMQASFKE